MFYILPVHKFMELRLNNQKSKLQSQYMNAFICKVILNFEFQSLCSTLLEVCFYIKFSIFKLFYPKITLCFIYFRNCQH